MKAKDKTASEKSEGSLYIKTNERIQALNKLKNEIASLSEEEQDEVSIFVSTLCRKQNQEVH